ncbi:hypothetical protein BN13_320005 [Nostocoides jenkinsii Ben 74]|uniref:Uncharacterized protein n=1 Tax=Nostocoides jenkinsii Ben 74 TaxID=1193518 RepID=A0A077M7F7_9MICO|nr:hypothetical protein BN13_320005 [Tetrasphaera jenkinsii Ben 74]
MATGPCGVARACPPAFRRDRAVMLITKLYRRNVIVASHGSGARLDWPHGPDRRVPRTAGPHGRRHR